MRICKTCNTEFEPTGRNQKWCKPCGELRSNEMTRASDLRRLRKKKYGITEEQYNKMFDDQNGCCAICGSHQTNFKHSLAVDHCHTSTDVRGLLCTKCNLLLGYAKDNIDILTSAIEYLKRSR